MTVADFERALRSFVDDASELNVPDGRIRVEIRNEVVEARLGNSSGLPHVIEDGDRIPAARWLTRRIARLQLLADRILAHVEAEPCFVDPSGTMLDRNGTVPMGEEQQIDCVSEMLLRSLKGSDEATTVHYLTSKPGGGMTTLINMTARRQAQKFKRKEADWLLLPIRLWKRSFLGFDEIMVVELANRLHFHLSYYDAVIELAKMGVVVPALDGFEDMLIGRSVGGATSALGHLIRDLDSRGSLLVAARKAHFEYSDLETRAKLVQPLAERRVKYVRTSISPWNRRQFMDYAQRRGLHDGRPIHAKVEGCVGADHPLLTRPVMVSRVLDAAGNGLLDGLLTKWRDDPGDYFRSIVQSIVARGAWAGSLFTVDEHHRLLASIAKEMWMTSTNLFRRDYLESIAQEFALRCGKNRDAVRQLGTEITQHPLIAAQGQRYAFVHEDFRRHYLGEALGRVLVSPSDGPEGLAEFMHKGVLSSRAADSAVDAAKRQGVDMRSVLGLLQGLAVCAPGMSYTLENAGALVLRCLELIYDQAVVKLSGFVFPEDGLTGRRLEAVSFRECRFHGTSLTGAQIGGCRFADCTMLGLEWPRGFVANGAVIRGGSVASVVVAGGDVVRVPADVAGLLTRAGFRVEALAGVKAGVRVEPGDDARTADPAVPPAGVAGGDGVYGYNSSLQEKEPQMERHVREGSVGYTGVEEVQDATEDEGDVPADLRHALMSHGADMRVDTIVERIEREDIVVPSFPGRPVWTPTQASRFVESLLLGLAVPGVYLFMEPDTRRHLVVDGQQRLRTLHDYYKGTFADGSKFRLSGVSTQFSGRGYWNLQDGDRRELDDSLIHTTVLEQVEPGGDRSSIYDVFERLNAGRTYLKPQEIRMCLYRGRLNELLSELAVNPSWRQLSVAWNSRKRDEEIILRCLALVYRTKEYERPMKFFLNRFMEENRNPTGERREEFREVFMKTVGEVAEVLGPGALRPEGSLNVAVTDATVVGLAHRLSRGPILDKAELEVAHAKLLSALRQEGLYRTGTTDKTRLQKRLELARVHYAGVR